MFLQESEAQFATGAARQVPVPATRWDRAKPWLAWITGGLFLGWALAVIWWAVLSPNARPPSRDELTIPLGTAAAIASGQGAFIPATVSLAPGGLLVVYNHDEVEHSVGNVVIPPGATAEITAPAENNKFACSIHPSRFLSMNLTKRPSFLTTVVPALLVGLPIGLMAGAAAWVGGRIKFDDD